MILSAIQGIAKIYKIHGTSEEPGLLVISQTNYTEFPAKSKFLASKLMIFMEYPLIFADYSLSDNNVISIINSIVNCLDETLLTTLQDKFVFYRI